MNKKENKRSRRKTKEKKKDEERRKTKKRSGSVSCNSLGQVCSPVTEKSVILARANPISGSASYNTLVPGHLFWDARVLR